MNINNKTKKIRHDKETQYNKNKIVFPATTVMTILLLASVAVVVGGLVVTINQQTAFATAEGLIKVPICHFPHGNPGNQQDVTVGAPSVPAHVRNHGDTLGPCPPEP
jgi:hypothetical protein